MTAKEYFDDVRVRAKRQQDALRGITNHGEGAGRKQTDRVPLQSRRTRMGRWT